jgi:hypothetical protein
VVEVRVVFSGIRGNASVKPQICPNAVWTWIVHEIRMWFSRVWSRDQRHTHQSALSQLAESHRNSETTNLSKRSVDMDSTRELYVV